MATSLEDVLKRARSKIAESGNRKERPAKPGAGRSVWRILPGWRKDNASLFYHDYGQHFVKDLEGDIKAVIVCPKKTFGQDCDVCDAVYKALKAAPDDAARSAILESRSVQRFLVNAYQPDGEQKVQILELPTTVFEQLVNAMDEYPNMLDPTEGQDVIITREGVGKSTKYTLTVRPPSKSKPVPKSLLMQLHDLDEYVKEDSETKWEKALEVLGTALSGGVSASAAHRLTGPASEGGDGVNPPELSLTEELDDSIPHTGADEGARDVEDAEVVEDAKTTEAFGEDIGDADIEKLLADL